MTTAFEQTLDADTAMVAAADVGPGIAVILVAADGRKHRLRGFFEAAGQDVVPGAAHASVMSTAPMLHIPITNVTAALGRPLSRRDNFIVRGIKYRVQQPLPDGYGMIACKLLEDTNA